MKASIVFTPLVIKLSAVRCRLPSVIIYCRRCEECAELYHFFHSSLKQEFTEQVGAPNLAMFRLVDVHTGVTRKSIRDSIVASFGSSHAPVRQVIHWGPSLDIESYVQECGHAGRNGLPSNAVLFWKMADFRFQSKEMELYCRSQEECRRAMLTSYFDCTNNTIAGCKCCDVCAAKYKCTTLSCDFFILFPFHCVRLQATIIPSTCIYIHENHEYTNAEMLYRTGVHTVWER